MHANLAELRAREEEVDRVARVKAEQGDAAAFQLMQRQAMAVGQRRVELRIQMAELERSPAMIDVPEDMRGMGESEVTIPPIAKAETMDE